MRAFGSVSEESASHVAALATGDCRKAAAAINKINRDMGILRRESQVSRVTGHWECWRQSYSAIQLGYRCVLTMSLGG